MVRLSSRSVVQKCHHDDKEGKRSDGEDRISGLPDEIIVAILSRLTLKEAMSTSILSRRWRYIWTFITSNLNFDTGMPLCANVCKVCDGGEVFIRQREIKKPKFVGWVNHVVKEHQGGEVDKFRVCFSLDKSYSRVLDTWVKFAFQKSVRELELNLTKSHGYSHNRCYSFLSVEKLNMLPMNFTRLTALRLMDVDVTAEVVQYFLAKCPFLVQLCVVSSNTLSTLIIGGESLKLKYLDLYRCIPLENLEVSAPNLVSFSYTGPQKEVPFKNVPLLSELCIGDEYCESFIFEAPKHSSYLSKLEKLTLVLPSEVSEALSFPSNLPELFNLKQLELRIGITRGYRLDCFTSLIKTAPLLSKFVLKLAFIGSINTIVEREFPWGKWLGSRAKHSHKCLKEIEFVGFTGHETESELALHLLEISASLEKITVDTRHPGNMWGPSVYCQAFEREAEDREGAKERAQPLRSHVPAGAELVIV